MKKLTNTLYMIIVLLMFGAAQSAPAQIRTTSSASLAQEPTATISAPAQSNVGHYGYKSGQTYTPTIQNRNNSATPVVSPIRKSSQANSGIITGASATAGSSSLNQNSIGSGRMTNVFTDGTVVANGAFLTGDDDVVPGGGYAGGVVPMGNTVVPLIILLLCYCLFLLVRGDARKDQEEAA